MLKSTRRVTAPVPMLAALVALSLLSGAARADETQDAAKLLRAGQHQQALERVNRALAAKPRDAQARFLKGLILTEQGNAKEATEIFLKLTQDYPDLPEPYNNLAVIYAAQGQYDKARAALEQSIRTHPTYATAYENLGDVYAKLASQAYDKALQIDSSNTGAQNKLALVRDLVGGAPRALKPPVAVAQKEAPKPEPAKPPIAEKPAPETPRAAAEKPKPAAEKPKPDEIIETVNAWAKAWSSKDVNVYLAFYASDFRTPGGEPREAWERGRRQRISAPKSISVSIDAPKVTLTGDNQASVAFRQSYRSDVIKATGNKTLVLVKSNGRWLIQQEKVN
jgi:tetratricopeptide (TPR) repeat protein